VVNRSLDRLLIESGIGKVVGASKLGSGARSEEGGLDRLAAVERMSGNPKGAGGNGWDLLPMSNGLGAENSRGIGR